MKISSLTARPILDSRGQWTVEVALTLQNGVRAVASVPQERAPALPKRAPCPGRWRRAK